MTSLLRLLLFASTWSNRVEAAAEAGNDTLPVQRVTRAELGLGAVGPVDAGATALRVHDPDQQGPAFEPLPDFGQDLPRPVVLEVGPC
jgi:hypothetical protein